MRLQMRDVMFLAGRVDHQEQIVPPPRDHQVIQHAAVWRGEEAVALAAAFQPLHIHRHQPLKRRIGVQRQQHLAHMADIEKPRLFARMQVFGHHARGILHRHFIAREGHELAAKLGVQLV